MRKKLLLVIVAALLSAQAEDGGWYSGQHGQWGSGGLMEDEGVVGGLVVESGRHTQWGSLRYPVRPGQYTVIGELIQGGGVVGIPRVRNPNPQVVAEQVRSSAVIYTPSRTPPPSTPGEVPDDRALILYDPNRPGEPLAYFNNEDEARYYLSDRFFNELSRRGHLVAGSPGGVPHFTRCSSEECREISAAPQEFKSQDRYNAERALEGFLDTVREVGQAIIDFVLDVVQAVVDFFAGLFDWVENAVNDIVAGIDNDSGNSPSNDSGNNPSDSSFFPGGE